MKRLKAVLEEEKDNAMEILASPRFDVGPFGKPRIAYAIASVGRSGSTLLSHALFGIAGVPGEFLHPMMEEAWIKRLGEVGTVTFLRRLMCLRTTENGYFGMKAHATHAEKYLSMLPAVLDLWIYNYRENHLKQAISGFKAQKTDVWSVSKKQSDDGQPRLTEEAYDYGGIAKSIRFVEHRQASWEKFFKEANITPLVVRYEDLEADYHGTISNVFRYLGLEYVAAEPTLKKQSDEVSQYFYTRFLEDAKEKGHEISPQWLI